MDFFVFAVEVERAAGFVFGSVCIAAVEGAFDLAAFPVDCAVGRAAFFGVCGVEIAVYCAVFDVDRAAGSVSALRIGSVDAAVVECYFDFFSGFAEESSVGECCALFSALFAYLCTVDRYCFAGNVFVKLYSACCGEVVVGCSESERAVRRGD